MRLQIGRVYHHRLRNGRLGGQAFHHPGEDAFLAPALPTIIEGLRWTILLGRIAPPQAIAIDEDNAAENTPVIDARLAVALREKRLKAGHLRIRQPEKVAHDPVSLRSLNHAARLKSMGPDPSGLSVIRPVNALKGGQRVPGHLFDMRAELHINAKQLEEVARKDGVDDSFHASSFGGGGLFFI